MRSKFIKKPGSVIELQVELDQKEFQGYWQTVYDNALANVHLKGFRPGTAPKELADKAVDKDKVFEEAARKAVHFSLDAISGENSWIFVDAPKIELQESPLGLKYKANLTIFPKVETGNYKKIAKRILGERKDVGAEADEIQKSLDWLRNSRAKITKVNREARKGDFIDVDIKSDVDSINGEKFILGEGYFMPGFEEKLENHKAGETLEFTLTAPNDYLNEKLRGKTINFKVKLNDVFEREVPELTDEFAQGLSPNFKTVEDIKKNISEGLKQEKEMKENDRIRIKILDEIIKDSKMEIPEIMIQKTLDNMISGYKPIVEKIGKTEEELRKQFYDKAKNNVAGNLILYKIAELEKLQPTPEEIGAVPNGVDDKEKYNYNYGIELNKKVFQFLESQE